MTTNRAALAASIDAAETLWLATPIVWGASDCLTSVLAVLRQHGFAFDPFKHGRWTTALGYRRVLKRAGFDSLEHAIAWETKALGLPEIDPADAQVGDLGITPLEIGQTCALAKGNGFYVGRRADYALAVRPAKFIERAWSVLP